MSSFRFCALVSFNGCDIMTLSRVGLQGAVRRVATATGPSTSSSSANVIKVAFVRRHSWMRASRGLQWPKHLRPFSSSRPRRDDDKTSPLSGMLVNSPHVNSLPRAQLPRVNDTPLRRLYGNLSQRQHLGQSYTKAIPASGNGPDPSSASREPARGSVPRCWVRQLP